MDQLEVVLRKSVKLSCIDEEKLLRRKVALDDSLELLTTLRNDMRSRYKSQDVIDAIGVAVIATSMVSDIIRDTAGEVVSKESYLMKFGLEKVYDKVRDKKWAGNKYAKTIDAIQENSGYLEELIDKLGGATPAGEMIKMLVTVHKNIAANAVGLVGHMEDAGEAKRALARSLNALERDIAKAKEASDRLKYYLETGEGSSTRGERMSRIPPRQPAPTSRLP